MTEEWTVPPELAPYGKYTNYPDRAEELINSDATYKNNVILAAMACEAAAQWGLLARLRKAGLLLQPDDAPGVLCGACFRPYNNGCPDCGACEAGCHDGFKDNPCAHERANWSRDKR